jgi:hypothetical protein
MAARQPACGTRSAGSLRGQIFALAPLPRTTRTRGRIPKRPTGADCKSAGTAFAGSNPAPPTILRACALPPRSSAGSASAEPSPGETLPLGGVSGRATDRRPLAAFLIGERRRTTSARAMRPAHRHAPPSGRSRSSPRRRPPGCRTRGGARDSCAVRRSGRSAASKAQAEGARPAARPGRCSSFRGAPGSDAHQPGVRGADFKGARPHPPGWVGLRSTGTRGCSSVVERQPSKLKVWVRFPSPAPVASSKRAPNARRGRSRPAEQCAGPAAGCSSPLRPRNDEIQDTVALAPRGPRGSDRRASPKAAVAQW